MRTLNPTLLRDSIREAVAARNIKQCPPTQQRRIIHSVYNRKIKEFSSIYPFIFAVENGIRSVLADYTGERLGRMDWWTLVRDAKGRGKSPGDLTHINGTQVPAGFIKAVWGAIDRITNPIAVRKINGADRVDEFYYCLTLGDMWSIVDSHWPFMRDMFCPDNELGYSLNKTAFNNTMRVIKEARNELFHSNPIKDRRVVVDACERLLDAMQFHLGDYDLDLSEIRYARIPPTITRQGRHAIPAR
ncbi:hypothetical protein [Methylopila sp. M107]|uniref:hypothetical protein n=1 Tax=Methylopila sp. M107 TaxID=1101190 RepID=UPI0012DF38D1|nr:hypothetical protein [Methylopila sp. M107]